MKSTIMEMIEKNNYVNYEKYKLNIKMPLIYVLKYYVLCMYLWRQFEKGSIRNVNNVNNVDSNKIESEGNDTLIMYRVN